MRLSAGSLVLALVLGAAAGCAGDEDARSDTDGGNGCVAGQQVSCACPGGGEGVQVCNADGSAYAACMGCDDVGTSSATADDDAADDAPGSTTDPTDAMSTSGATLDDGEVTGPPAESEGGDTFLWAWIDHGGPAYLPPPCAATAGVVDGLLVDPQAYFFSLVEGTDADDWEAVMNAIEPQLWACGIGQQRGTQGNVRGRLFLPTEACPDASPPADDPEAMHLGVRQEEACWAHFVDVLMDA